MSAGRDARRRGAGRRTSTVDTVEAPWSFGASLPPEVVSALARSAAARPLASQASSKDCVMLRASSLSVTLYKCESSRDCWLPRRKSGLSHAKSARDTAFAVPSGLVWRGSRFFVDFAAGSLRAPSPSGPDMLEDLSCRRGVRRGWWRAVPCGAGRGGRSAGRDEFWQTRFPRRRSSSLPPCS